MTKFISNVPREQFSLLPFSIDDFVSRDSYVHVIKAFVDALDLSLLGFERTTPNCYGAPSYDPKDLLSLYIYGYLDRIKSSRRLEKATYNNVEVIWLINNLHPDHNTIADFRKINGKPLKGVFSSFNKITAELFSKSNVAQDGTKLRAVNSKDNNFTAAKLDDRIKRANNQLEKYMEELNINDANDTASAIPSTVKDIEAIKQKITKFTSLLNQLEVSNESQISLVDPQSRLMKNASGGFDVAFNVQTAVDSQNHLIADFEVTNAPNDNGQMLNLASKVKDTFGSDVLENLADGGYVSNDDINNCLDNKIVPILPEPEKGSYVVERDYIPNVITDEEKKGTTTENVKKCLDAGVIPDCYSDLNMEIAIVEKTEKIEETPETLSNDDMVAKAKEGYFVRDINKDKVLCPQGFILRRKAVCNGKIRYYSSTACTKCKNKCTTSKFRFADFKPNQTLMGNKKFNTSVPKKKTTKVKVKKVCITYIPDKEKYKNRKCLVEHPFGWLKRFNEGSYVLLQGKKKITGELSLAFLGYNIKRVVNVLGVDNLVNLIKEFSSNEKTANIPTI